MGRPVFMLIKTGLAVERSEGLRIQGVYRSALAHYAFVQTQNALRVAIHHAEIVRNQQKSRSTLHLDAMEKRVDCVFEACVHSRSRFIEQEHAGFLQQSRCDEHALRLAARQFAQSLPQNVLGKSHQLQLFVQLAVEGSGRTPEVGGLEQKKFHRRDGGRAIDRKPLWNISDLYARTPLDQSGVRKQTQQGSKQNCFASAVGANYGEGFARPEGERDVVEHGGAIQGNGEIFNGEDGVVIHVGLE